MALVVEIAVWYFIPFQLVTLILTSVIIKNRTVYLVYLFLSFRVIDLGVMVPCEKILREAIRQKAGILDSLSNCKQHRVNIFLSIHSVCVIYRNFSQCFDLCLS